MPTRPSFSIERVAVVGAGFMGRQIAERSAAHGMDVVLIDVSADALAGVSVRTSLALEAASDADLVIEAIPERLDLKLECFGRLDAVCGAEAVLATNSSSIRVSELEGVVRRRDRMLNLHFFGPLDVRPMAELMGGSETAAWVVDAVRAYCRRIGIAPLLVRRESTGFLFNRVWRSVKKECLRVVADGVGSVEDVDRAWMIFTGQPMGPFGQMDLIGLDVVRDIELVYWRESGADEDRPPAFLEEMVARGQLGVKTGKGFYEYPDPAYGRAGFLAGD